MLVDLAAVAAILAVGNVLFRHFEPRMPWWRRVLKTALALAATAALSHWIGRTGVVVAGGVALLAFGYVHGIQLPRHGVNGWTAEPWEKYCELRGWTTPEQKRRG